MGASFVNKRALLLAAVGIVLIPVMAQCSSGGDDNGNTSEAGDETSQQGPDAPGAMQVRAEEYGDAWPLTIDEGVLSCDADRVVFTAPDGAVYALNGLAETHADQEGWSDVDPIWADNPSDSGGPKLNIGPLIDDGLALCD
jgi:hypothetical protein